MTYTAKFAELHELLAVTYPASYSGEQNTDYVYVGNFHRLVIMIVAGNIGTSLDVDIEIATDSAGAGLVTMTGKSITQLTQAGSDDDSVALIEIRGEEFNVEGVHYDYLRVESTPSGASLYTVLIWGAVPRNAPASVTALDEVVN